MNGRHTLFVGGISAALIGGIVFSSYTLQHTGRPTVARQPAAADAGLVDPAGASVPSSLAETERLIRVYEQRSRSVRDAGELTFLAQLYLQRGRVTGDVTTYGQARAALLRALALAPHDLSTRTLLASTQATEHDFAAALATSRQVLVAAPGDPAAMAVEGDALLETGGYDRARRVFDELNRRTPNNAAILVRRARIAWLTGDIATARSLADQATRAAVAAGSFGAGLAFYPAFAGQLELEQGQYTRARDLYQQALTDAPGWHVALAGLGRAEAALGDYPRAAALLQQAVDVVPQPDYLAALGDVFSVEGDRAQARTQYDTVTFTGRLAAINRQLFNRQLVLFDADHGLDTRVAVQLAERELAVRKDIYGWDAYAWALQAAGQSQQAMAADAHALELGSRDPRLLYHAGVIAHAVHDDTRARDLLTRALTISPAFDPLQAPRARALLSHLTGART